MLKQRILQDGSDDGFGRLVRNPKPVTKFKDLMIYHRADISKKLVRLTKWLPPVPTELSYIYDEYRRIKADKTRVCIVATENHRVALFVNDLTNGAFEALGEEN